MQCDARDTAVATWVLPAGRFSRIRTLAPKREREPEIFSIVTRILYVGRDIRCYPARFR